MVASRRMHWLRCILLAGLCYSLVLQTLLVQARGIAAAGADPQFVLCHSDSDQSPGEGDDAAARCHFCFVLVSGTALLPDAGSAISVPAVITASAYSFFSARIIVARPPPRGFSRAPPYFA
jgi:hypothetical protein